MVSKLALRRVTSVSAFALAAAGWAVPASAEIVETSQIRNSLSYSLGGTFDNVFETGVLATDSQSGGTLGIERSVRPNGFLSEMKLNMQGTLDQSGNFYFLSTGTCLGYCTVRMTTVLGFTFTNTGSEDIDLRFDSMLTPGHLARMNVGLGQSDPNAYFDFSVTQDDRLIYTADGITAAPRDDSGRLFTVNPAPFNGANEQQGPNWATHDWSATNLSFSLGRLAAGASTYLEYNSTVVLGSYREDCLLAAECSGFQIAFGDPRNNGAIISRGVLENGQASPASGYSNPAVGADYDAFLVPYRLVEASAPPSFVQPAPNGPITYTTAYVELAGGVPEPSAWALLILGFGAVGAALRRRRVSFTFA